jgi:hypothetical protein
MPRLPSLEALTTVVRVLLETQYFLHIRTDAARVAGGYKHGLCISLAERRPARSLSEDHHLLAHIRNKKCGIHQMDDKLCLSNAGRILFHVDSRPVCGGVFPLESTEARCRGRTHDLGTSVLKVPACRTSQAEPLCVL